MFADKAPPGYDGSAVVYSEVITEEEESTVLLDLKEIFKRYVCRSKKNGFLGVISSIFTQLMLVSFSSYLTVDDTNADTVTR